MRTANHLYSLCLKKPTNGLVPLIGNASSMPDPRQCPPILELLSIIRYLYFNRRKVSRVAARKSGVFAGFLDEASEHLVSSPTPNGILAEKCQHFGDATATNGLILRFFLVRVRVANWLIL